MWIILGWRYFFWWKAFFGRDSYWEMWRFETLNHRFDVLVKKNIVSLQLHTNVTRWQSSRRSWAHHNHRHRMISSPYRMASMNFTEWKWACMRRSTWLRGECGVLNKLRAICARVSPRRMCRSADGLRPVFIRVFFALSILHQSHEIPGQGKINSRLYWILRKYRWSLSYNLQHRLLPPAQRRPRSHNSTLVWQALTNYRFHLSPR